MPDRLFVRGFGAGSSSGPEPGLYCRVDQPSFCQVMGKQLWLALHPSPRSDPFPTQAAVPRDVAQGLYPVVYRLAPPSWVANPVATLLPKVSAMAIPHRSRRPRRGPWSAEEQRAIETAAAEGVITRIENGEWPECWRRLSWRKVQAEMFASQREPR